MKLLVAVKRVIDVGVKVRLTEDGGGVDTRGVKMVINPFDEVAVEAAVRQKEAGRATEIVAVACGPADTEETLRHALALGADRGVLVATVGRPECLAVAKLLCAIVAREQPVLVLLGKQATDDDASQIGQMLAGLLDWPQAIAVSALTLEGTQARVTREVDGGQDRLELDLPAVVTTDLRLNQPRFASLPNIMKAKRKTIERLDPAALGARVEARLETLALTVPPPRRAGRMVASVAELVRCLKDEARVL